MMDEKDLDAIEARAKAATPGPWEAWRSPAGYQHAGAALDPIGVVFDVSGGNPRADAEFIAAARTDVPALVAEVRRLRELLDGRDRLLDEREAALGREVRHVEQLQDRLAVLRSLLGEA